MPRTKVAKSAAKRVREGEDLVDEQVKDLENRVKFIYQDIEYNLLEKYEKLDEELETFRNSIPASLLNMKIGDLKRLHFPTFEGVAKYLESEKNLNATNNLDSSVRDEGYLTEASTTSSSHHAATRRTTKKSGMMGPLDSARARSRRSRSAGQLQTPSVLQSIRAKKPASAMKQSAAPPPPSSRDHHPPAYSLDDSMTSNASSGVAHSSRAKYRTPSGRTKAASADRVGTITPKVKMGTPISLLRYARMGETLVSASGSPVAGHPSIADDVNIAIPLADGVLSMRPTSLGEFDPELLHRIDPGTLESLRKLQDNLNMVIRQMDRQKKK